MHGRMLVSVSVCSCVSKDSKACASVAHLPACPPAQYDQECPLSVDAGSLSSPLCDAERTLALLLGVHLQQRACGPPLEPWEVQLQPWLESGLLRGGGLLKSLPPHDPFEEEKGEARSTGGIQRRHTRYWRGRRGAPPFLAWLLLLVGIEIMHQCGTPALGCACS
ncbi:hypothetical protein HPB48_007486 [Haemaphysalis longicornis]|uniref:Uncharacterized protein n=1 Tax=Haemaphysalis longicornis TaxID=44386 RepID=A0A9J6GH00_HAELO|nr:hypothetical protein HPB48_007486 [Haemaphysalis longicornis]